MKKLIFAFLLSLCAFFFACERDHSTDTDTNNDVDYPDYFQLKAGNYWVYEQFDVDSSGNAVTKNVFDSCYIEKDTMVGNIKYFKYVAKDHYSNFPEISYLRDSLHYIVDWTGSIWFSSQDFTTVFDVDYILAVTDTVCRTELKMADMNLSVQVPAGNFNTFNFQKGFYMYPNWSINGNPRFLNHRYAQGVGLVMKTFPFYSGSPDYREDRLIRYHLN